MNEKPLYQDEQLEVDDIFCDYGHILRIKRKDGINAKYTLMRGILSDLAQTPRGGIETKIHAYQDMILDDLKNENIGIDGLHVALCQAYMEEEVRIRAFSRTI